MANMSRKNSTASGHSPSRRSSRMDSLSEDNAAFPSAHSLRLHSTIDSIDENASRNRSPSLPVEQSNLSRSRSPSLPAPLAMKPNQSNVLQSITADCNLSEFPINRLRQISGQSLLQHDQVPGRTDFAVCQTEHINRSDSRNPEFDKSASRSNSAYTDRSDSGISDCSHSSLLGSFNKPWLIHEEDESDVLNGVRITGKINYPLCSTGDDIVLPKSKGVINHHSLDSASGELTSLE